MEGSKKSIDERIRDLTIELDLKSKKKISFRCSSIRAVLGKNQ